MKKVHMQDKSCITNVFISTLCGRTFFASQIRAVSREIFDVIFGDFRCKTCENVLYSEKYDREVGF